MQRLLASFNEPPTRGWIVQEPRVSVGTDSPMKPAMDQDQRCTRTSLLPATPAVECSFAGLLADYHYLPRPLVEERMLALETI